MLCTEDVSEVGLASGRNEKLWPDLTCCVDAFGLGACRSFFFEEPDGHVVDGDRCRIHTMLADGGEDFAGDPTAECLSFRLAVSYPRGVSEVECVTDVFEDEEWFSFMEA